jgi:hypothetical protein
MMNLKEIVSILWMVLRNLPLILQLIGRIREAFDPKKVSEALETLNELMGRIAPPAPAADSAGSDPANPEGDKRKRWLRFKNRIHVAGIVSDADAQELCNQYHPNNKEIA